MDEALKIVAAGAQSVSKTASVRSSDFYNKLELSFVSRTFFTTKTSERRASPNPVMRSPTISGRQFVTVSDKTTGETVAPATAVLKTSPAMVASASGAKRFVGVGTFVGVGMEVDVGSGMFVGVGTGVAVGVGVGVGGI
ncbi:hypothetical protein HY031_01665 [Candidatus Gottesmanbacteria bacterium]|nr:hypothetical protein [Candidatus Gottesmanbacteria bacterium]